MICRIRFIGSIDRLKFRSPFAILVNTKYQSVHGVNISMKNPMNMSIFPFKNRFPRKYPNNGVQMKLIIRLVDVNLMFLKLFFKFLRGTSKNKPYNIMHRNKLIKFPLFSDNISILLKISPIIIANIKTIGSSFSIKFIITPLFRYD